MTAYFTPHDGIPRCYALSATDRDDAMQEAMLLGRTMFKTFTYMVKAL